MAASYGTKPRFARAGSPFIKADVVYGPPARYGHLAETERNAFIVREVTSQQAMELHDTARELYLTRPSATRWLREHLSRS